MGRCPKNIVRIKQKCSDMLHWCIFKMICFHLFYGLFGERRVLFFGIITIAAFRRGE